MFELFNDRSGYNVVLGTATCLTNSMKKRKKMGINNGLISERDTTYERMLALNVSKKGKSEYVKIWKKLMEEFKNKNIT